MDGRRDPHRDRWLGRVHDRHVGHRFDRLLRLEPDAIVAAAIEVLDEHGYEGLSIRAIAQRLGVQGPALYWHFRNKQALLDQIAEAMLAAHADELRAPAGGEPWWEWLEGQARWLRRCLLSHRDGARVFAGVTMPEEPTFLRMLDMVVHVLHQAGLSHIEALQAAVNMYALVLGSTIEEQSTPPPEVFEEHRGAFPDAGALPSLAAAFADVQKQPDLHRYPEKTFEVGLSLFVDGIRARAHHSGPE